MFTIGWTGEAAAASLTIDLQNHVRNNVGFQRRMVFNLTRHPAFVQQPSWLVEKDPDEQLSRTWLWLLECGGGVEQMDMRRLKVWQWMAKKTHEI